MHGLKREILKILAVLITCTAITKQRTLIFFLFSYSWSFGILLWEMATMGKLKQDIPIRFFHPLFLKLVITFFC